MILPNSNNLPISKLAGVFNSTSATYKFYWFLGIIELVEEGKITILKKEIFAKMIANSWYTVNYFNISFGSQDLIQQANKLIKTTEQLSIDQNKYMIYETLLTSDNTITQKNLWHFDKNVPHWFLSPWFPSRSKQEIYELSKDSQHKTIYSLEKDTIRINNEWIDYLKQNAKILKNFIFWNLSLFLQVRNPNTPDIPNKLIKPASRNPLLNQRKFWNFIFDELGSIDCIYTGKRLTSSNYDVEHFIPYSFVSHDQIWNLIPGDKSFNIRKSNKLPLLDKYFSPFYNLQKIAFEIYTAKKPKEKLLQEYLYITPDFERGISEEKFFDVINPLITIAHNNGFEFLSE